MMDSKKEKIVKLTENDIINIQMFLSRVDIKGKEAFLLCGLIQKLEKAENIEPKED